MLNKRHQNIFYLPLHILFSCPVYVFICNMHLFSLPSREQSLADTNTSLAMQWWEQVSSGSHSDETSHIISAVTQGRFEFRISRCYAPWPCWLFSIHSTHSVFFILFSVLQHTVFSTNSYFMKIMCQNLESAIFYKDTKAGPQFRKVLICMLCAL